MCAGNTKKVVILNCTRPKCNADESESKIPEKKRWDHNNINRGNAGNNLEIA